MECGGAGRTGMRQAGSSSANGPSLIADQKAAVLFRLSDGVFAFFNGKPFFRAAQRVNSAFRPVVSSSPKSPVFSLAASGQTRQLCHCQTACSEKKKISDKSAILLAIASLPE